jgi:hypothetical protein
MQVLTNGAKSAKRMKHLDVDVENGEMTINYISMDSFHLGSREEEKSPDSHLSAFMQAGTHCRNQII